MKQLFSTGLRWLWLAVLLFALDFASKQWVLNNMSLHQTIPLMPSLNLFHAHNYGAAFSFLGGKQGWERWFFAGIALGVILVLFIIMYRNRANQKLANIASALIIGGAIGNLLDRLMHGFVVDFFDFYIKTWHFATFNVADCGICVGAALFILDSFFPSSTPSKKKKVNL